ncbi:OmpA family protein [Azonexus sp.]|uniref:OmpA family protein n=1 Tax=Azonexus sp. TaxID=1872668 RepID=UPI0039E4DC19
MKKGYLWVFLCAFLLLACQSVPEKTGNLTAQQIAALQAEGFVQDADNWVFSASDKLLFDSSEAVLRDEAKRTVDRIAAQLIRSGIGAVRVDGHADFTGSRSQNRALSLRRAEAVAERLRAAGMASEQILVRGLGSDFPVTDNYSDSGKAQNRRVVLVVGG